MFSSRNILILFIGFVCLASCSQVVYFPIEIKSPSKIALTSAAEKTVLVVDNTPFYTKVVTKMYFADGDSGRNVHHFDSLGVLFKTELAESLREKKFSNNVLYTTASVGNHKMAGDATTLPLDSIRQLHSDTDADLILSIDLFQIDSKFGSEKIDYGTYFDSLQTTIHVKLNAFSGQGKRLLPTVNHTDSLVWETQVVGSTHKKTLDKAFLYKAMKAATVQLAKWMSDDFMPEWEKQTRWYYTSGNEQMKAAAAYARDSHWVKAAKIWGDLYDKEEKYVVLARLASNIALANEMNDDIENAINWIKIAKEYFGYLSDNDKIRLAEYESDLEERRLEFKKLDEENQ